jgi:hypothetical protein
MSTTDREGMNVQAATQFVACCLSNKVRYNLILFHIFVVNIRDLLLLFFFTFCTNCHAPSVGEHSALTF